MTAAKSLMLRETCIGPVPAEGERLRPEKVRRSRRALRTRAYEGEFVLNATVECLASALGVDAGQVRLDDGSR